MTINEIYSKYKILPNLQLHMRRVACVSKLICEGIEDYNEKNDIIIAMLLHDMGNIIKFDLTLFPEFLEPMGLAYWESVKNEYINKYGNEEHQAIYDIAYELKISTRVFELIQSVGFSKTIENSQIDDIAKKICCYSDQRVTPFRIVSINERLREGMTRKIHIDNEEYKRKVDALKLLEVQIFNVSTIFPSEITNNTIESNISSDFLDNIEIN